METVFPDDIDDRLFDNFNITFGLTAFDGDEEPIDDPKYGRIFARYQYWGFEGFENGVKFQEIETHRCTEEELGVDKNHDNQHFFEIEEKNIKEI